MERRHNPIGRNSLMEFGLALALCGFISVPVHACTIFVLTGTNRALFCNNEDWSNPKTRIWFVPGNDKHYGGVYVGFDNDYAQGGLNTKGLAFDWVAGYTEKWKPDPRPPLFGEIRVNKPSKAALPSKKPLPSFADIKIVGFTGQKYSWPTGAEPRSSLGERTTSCRWSKQTNAGGSDMEQQRSTGY